MKVLELTQKVTGGKLVIDVPENYEGKELNIVIKASDSTSDPENWADLPAKERVKILERFKGTAKYPDTKIDKLEWYDQ
jgi:hypothetical protein